jgi:hypothetical protein
VKFVEAFRKLDASLVNPQWACSAVAGDGSLVFSCWQHLIKVESGRMRYEDRLSRWAHNSLGSSLAAEHLRSAIDHGIPVRLIVARSPRPSDVDQGIAANDSKNDFDPRPDAVGRVVEFDGDRFVIEFSRAAVGR